MMHYRCAKFHVSSIYPYLEISTVGKNDPPPKKNNKKKKVSVKLISYCFERVIWLKHGHIYCFIDSISIWLSLEHL